MRDKRFIAIHRGGLLTKEHHYQLINWACICAEHVLPLFGEKFDEQLKYALLIAEEWQKGNATIAEARKASVNAHALARATTNPVSGSVARAVGHAVATAHMSDHSLGAAVYALKAVKYSGQSVIAERSWQNEQLPTEIRELVLSSRIHKDKVFKSELNIEQL